MHAHEASERAVMLHEGIGDRTDHLCGAGNKPRIQKVAEIDDLGRAVGSGHIAHAMVGDDAEARAERQEARKTTIDLAHEVERLRRVRRMLVLHVVRQRQIHQVGLARFEEPDACVEHEQREIGRVLVRRPAPDEATHIGDAVLRLRHLVRLLGRKSDAFEILRERLAQLVFGRDGSHGRARLRERRQERRRPHRRGVDHHDFRPRLRIEVEIPGHAVDRGWYAAHDRDVVGVRKGRHRRQCQRREAFAPHPVDGRDGAGAARGVDIRRIASVEADNDGGKAGPSVAAAVDRDRLRFIGCAHTLCPPALHRRTSRVFVVPLPNARSAGTAWAVLEDRAPGA